MNPFKRTQTKDVEKATVYLKKCQTEVGNLQTEQNRLNTDIQQVNNAINMFKNYLIINDKDREALDKLLAGENKLKDLAKELNTINGKLSKAQERLTSAAVDLNQANGETFRKKDEDIETQTMALELLKKELEKYKNPDIIFHTSHQERMESAYGFSANQHSDSEINFMQEQNKITRANAHKRAEKLVDKVLAELDSAIQADNLNIEKPKREKPWTAPKPPRIKYISEMGAFYHYDGGN